MTVEIGSRHAELPREHSSQRPLYARVLNLRNLQPGGLLCFLFFEGALAVGILLALAEVIDWWGILVLPAFVAAMVKVNDAITGPPDSADLPAGERVRRQQARYRRLTAVGRASVTPAFAPPSARPRSASPATPRRRAEKGAGGAAAGAAVTPSSLAHARAATTAARYDSPPSAQRYGNSATASPARFGAPLGNDAVDSSHWRLSRENWPVGDTWAGAPNQGRPNQGGPGQERPNQGRSGQDTPSHERAFNGPYEDLPHDAVYGMPLGSRHGAAFHTSYGSWSPADHPDQADHTPWPEPAAPPGPPAAFADQPHERGDEGAWPAETPLWTPTWTPTELPAEAPAEAPMGTLEAGAHAAPDPWPSGTTDAWTQPTERGRHGAPEPDYGGYPAEAAPPAPLGFTTVDDQRQPNPPEDPLRRFAASVRAAVEGRSTPIVARKTANGRHARNGDARSRRSANYRYPNRD